MQKGTRSLAVVASTSRAATLFEISDGDLEALRADISLCRRTRTVQWLDHHRNLLRSANPVHPNTPIMLGYLVQWEGVGANLMEELAVLESCFPPANRGRLPLASYLFLRFSGGVLNFLRKKSDNGDLDFVISVSSSGCAGNDPLLFAHLWKAQLERHKGALEPALSHARLCRELSLQSGYPALAAKSQALEAFILLDSGLPNAAEIMRQAETVLLDSDDWLWRGRIQEGLGQAALQEGQYQSALDHFRNAADLLARSPEPHCELGWAHFYIARAQRFMASRLAKNIDAAAELRRRSLRSEANQSVPSNSHSRQRLGELRSEALSALSQAEAVFRSIQESRALDSVCLERGALWAASGDLHQAAQYARESLLAGRRRQDALLTAQARLLESRVEQTYCDEGVGFDLISHAERASEYLKESLALALQCSAKPAVKRRLLAAIYISEGLLLLNGLFHNPAAARECCHSAGQYVNPSHRDELWEEYQLLVFRALHSESIDARLRQWSEGLAEGKTFQQITEEFAEVVIPAIWAREGKNTSRVVAKLSISPKKVRRILSRAGLKG